MRFTYDEAIIAASIGTAILKEIPEPEPLRGKYLSLYEEYIQQINADIQEVTNNWNDDKDIQTCALDELNDEKIHVECVFRFLQEKGVLL